MQLSEIRKTIVAIATTIVAVGPWVLQAEGVIHMPLPITAVVSLVLGAAGWVAHYLAPNVTEVASRVQGRSVMLKGEKPLDQAA